MTDSPLLLLSDLSSILPLVLGDVPAADERWWRFLGRLHPLMVHFPIALAIAAAAVELVNILRRHREASPFAFTATGFAAVAACFAAWFGWLNADFEGATPDNTLFLHRWLGIVAAAGLVVVFVVGTFGRDGKRMRALNGYRWGLVVCAILVGVGAHFGGSMVYGSGYLTKVLFPPTIEAATVSDSQAADAKDATDAKDAKDATDAKGATDEKVPAAAPADGVPVEDDTTKTVSFVADVLPILQARCVECHGPDKVKGSLRMDTAAELFAGDAEWWTVIPGQPEDSLLLQRIELPAADPDAMPPKGDRLNAKEIETIRAWIAAGATHAGSVPASSDAKLVEPAGESETEAEASKAATTVGAPPSAAGIRTAVAALRERKVVVGPISQADTDFELNASLVKPPFADDDLARLDGLQPVLVWANFARSALTDDGIAPLGGFDRITRLRIDNTGLGDGAVDTLLTLPKLETLNMYGTKLTDAGLAKLASHPGLTRLYCDDSDVTAAGVAAARAGRAW